MAIDGFEDGRTQTEECEKLLKTGKVKKIDLPLEPSE